MITPIKNRPHVKSLLIRGMALCLFFILAGNSNGGTREIEAPTSPSAFADGFFKAHITHIKEGYPLANREDNPDRWHQQINKRHPHRLFLLASAGRQKLIASDSVIRHVYSSYLLVITGDQPDPSSPRGPPCA